MARDVTLRGTASDLAGDETYELWLQHESDAWSLEATGDVVVDAFDHQDFLIPTLVNGAHYTAQLRCKRAGRYRAGYLTADPDTWPSQSRCEFVPGALEGVSAPTINSGSWERTSSSTTDTTINITPFDNTKDIKVYRDGVLLATVPEPFTGAFDFIDHDPPVGANHEYTARHTAGFEDGPLSSPFDVFAGPLAPTGVVQSSPTTDFGSYTIDWSAGGEEVQVQDDFVCPATFANQGALTTASSYHRFVESDITPDHGTQDALFHARVRAEVTSFGVTDVTDWVTIPVECLIYDDNAEFSSCP